MAGRWIGRSLLAALAASAAVGMGARADDAIHSARLLEVPADRCEAVMAEINMADELDAEGLTLTSQICYVARLTEHVARERLRLDAGSSGQDKVRSLENVESADERVALLALGQLEAQLEDAIERRDELLLEMSEADPHEVNDLLRRLLGSKKSKSN